VFVFVFLVFWCSFLWLFLFLFFCLLCVPCCCCCCCCCVFLVVVDDAVVIRLDTHHAPSPRRRCADPAGGTIWSRNDSLPLVWHMSFMPGLVPMQPTFCGLAPFFWQMQQFPPLQPFFDPGSSTISQSLLLFSFEQQLPPLVQLP